MPVTHSPGNPFAFSPAKPRAPLFEDAAGDFKHYRSPQTPLKEQQAQSTDEVQRIEYQFKEYQEAVAREEVIKDARIDELERLLLEESKKTERAESDKRFLFDLQAKQALELDSLRTELAKVRATSDSTIRELRDSNNKSTEECLTLRDSSRAERQQSEREVDRLEADLNNQRRAMDTLKADLTSKNDMLVEKNARILDLEQRCDEQALATPQGSKEDLAFVTKELTSSLSKINSLETANASQVAKIHQLQDVNAKLSVLSEEKLSLEHKLALMDETRSSLAEAQVRLVQLEQERAVWTDMVDEGEELDFSAILAKQKLKVETTASQLKLMEEQLNDSNVLVSSLKSELRALQAQLEERNVEITNEKRVHARLQRSKGMAVREITFLREQLKSYDMEEQLENPNFDALKDARLLELEKLVDEYRIQITQATEVEENKVVLGTKRGREEETNFNDIERGEYLRKIRSLNAELEITKREDTLLRQELDGLKATRSVGTQRILEYKENPTAKYQAIRTSTLTNLKTENAALVAELCGKGSVTVPIQTLRNAEQETRRLEGTIKQKEKMIQRLKEVFSAKSSEFREAVYSLLGYKLDFLPNGRVRLTSMYAETTEHAFIFDGEAGTMQLSGGDESQANASFMQAVGNLIKFWSGEKNSIPGMLSALTLELLEKEESLGDKSNPATSPNK